MKSWRVRNRETFRLHLRFRAFPTLYATKSSIFMLFSFAKEGFAISV